MRSASIGEWVIAGLTSRNRAASIVGDLLELEPEKGILWFWLSLAGVAIALAWRRPVAFIAAFCAGLWTLSGFRMAIWGLHAQHRPEQALMPAFGALTGVGMILWIAASYTAIRYGLRDHVARVAIAAASLVTVLIYCWWQPEILVACIALSLCLLWVCILNDDRRRAAMALLTALVAGFAGSVLAMDLFARYQHWVFPKPPGDREMQEHLWVGWVLIGFWLMVVWITTAVCSRMHRRLMRSALSDSEIESNSAV